MKSDIVNVVKMSICLLIPWIINTLISIYHGVGLNKEKFEIKKIINGIWKIAIFIICGILLICELDLIVNCFGSYDNDILNGISKATIFSYIGVVIINYLKQTLEKLKELLNEVFN